MIQNDLRVETLAQHVEEEVFTGELLPFVSSSFSAIDALCQQALSQADVLTHASHEK